jgi:hypothetical protein
MGWYIDYVMDKWERELADFETRVHDEIVQKQNLATAYAIGTIDEAQYLELLKGVNMAGRYKQPFRRAEDKFEKGSMQETEVAKTMEVLKKAVADLFKGKVDKRIKRKVS